MVRAEAWFNGFDKAAESPPIIPILGEVGHLVFVYFRADAHQHGCLDRNTLSSTPQLVVADQSPHETQDQLEILIINILSTYSIRKERFNN